MLEDIYTMKRINQIAAEEGYRVTVDRKDGFITMTPNKRLNDDRAKRFFFVATRAAGAWGEGPAYLEMNNKKEKEHKAMMDLFESGTLHTKEEAAQGSLFGDRAIERRQVAIDGLHAEAAHLLKHGQLPLSYARLLVGLDANFQHIALIEYNRRRASVGSFGKFCADLLARQERQDKAAPGAML